MGSLGLPAASEVPHALGEWNERLRLSDGFLAEVLPLAWRLTELVAAGAHGTWTWRAGGPPEIHDLAEALFRGGNPLAQITKCSLEGNDLRASFECREPITKAELNYTTDKGPWVDRHWQTMPAELDSSNRMASAKLPATTTVCYLNLFDAKDRVASGEHLVNEV